MQRFLNANAQIFAQVDASVWERFVYLCDEVKFGLRLEKHAHGI